MRAFSMAAFTLAALLTCAAMADDLHNQVEASMMVEGKAVINPDGSIASYSLRQPEKLPAPVIDLVKQNVATWKLVFVDTPPAPVEEKMTIRVVATDMDAKHATLHLRTAFFENSQQPGNEFIHARDRVQPTYPRRLIDARVSGTVYVLVRVGLDGHVLDAGAEQVNLHQLANPAAQESFRKGFAEAALKAVKQWTFDIPTAGPTASQPYWYVRVPFRFYLHEIGSPNLDSDNGNVYGSWEIYVRGPREALPWLQDPKLLASAPDSTPDNGVHQLGNGAQLATPPALN